MLHSKYAILLPWPYGPCMCAQAPVQPGMESSTFTSHPDAAIQTFRQDLMDVQPYIGPQTHSQMCLDFR